jgi:hypothetical protein
MVGTLRFAHPTDSIFKQPYLRILAACIARSFARNVPPSNQRAQGMPGARCARSLAGRKNSRTSSNSHHGHTGLTRHSPRNGFTGSFVLSPVIRIWLTPSSADNSTGLTPTSRRQDHTTSPSAKYAPSSMRTSRPPHPAANVRDDRETPLCVGRDSNGYRTDLGRGASEFSEIRNIFRKPAFGPDRTFGR